MIHSHTQTHTHAHARTHTDPFMYVLLSLIIGIYCAQCTCATRYDVAMCSALQAFSAEIITLNLISVPIVTLPFQETIAPT